MSDDNSDLTTERDRLLAEVARLQVSRTIGVPVGLLSKATTAEQAQAIADQALAWKAEVAPQAPQPTAPVHYSVSQISREQLRHLSPEQVSAVYHQGHLERIGAPAPRPRCPSRTQASTPQRRSAG